MLQYKKVTRKDINLILKLFCLSRSSFADDGEKSFVFTTDPTDYYPVKKCIIRKGYKILDSSLQFLPKNKVTLSESDLELAKKIYHKLEEEEDIVKIYDNIEWRLIKNTFLNKSPQLWQSL